MAVEPKEDYYRLLGVAVTADDDEVRRAWRKLALDWHPDRAGPGTTAMFQALPCARSPRTRRVARRA